MARPTKKGVETLIRLYRLYDGHREALLWFLEEFEAKSYSEYKAKYRGSSKERAYFTSVCGFFELAGVLVKRKIIDEDLFFDVFNPSPYWRRAKHIAEGMRKDRTHMYENFELLTARRDKWASRRR